MISKGANHITRLMSLDVFRGITITLMIIVNSPGNSMPYMWLDHSEWNGCTLADLVFPFFIVILGISSVLALTNLSIKGISSPILFKKVIQRSAYIFLMGLLLNAFPHHFDLDTIRILGVLQRIAICYFFSAVLFLTTSVRIQMVILIGLLIGYAALMTFFSPMGVGVDPLTLEGNLVGYIDRMIFSPGHLYTSTFDPEGLLSTLPAIASVIIGNLIGYRLIQLKTQLQQLKWMILTGSILAILGLLWNLYLPWNKALWSSSYVLWTSGLALLIFASIYALIEMKDWKRWSLPFERFGRHAMLVYMLHVLFLKVQAAIHVHNSAGQLVSLRIYITEIFFSGFSEQFASLCYSMGYTMLWLTVLMIVDNQKKRMINLVA